MTDYTTKRDEDLKALAAISRARRRIWEMRYRVASGEEPIVVTDAPDESPTAIAAARFAERYLLTALNAAEKQLEGEKDKVTADLSKLAADKNLAEEAMRAVLKEARTRLDLIADNLDEYDDDLRTGQPVDLDNVGWMQARLADLNRAAEGFVAYAE